MSGATPDYHLYYLAHQCVITDNYHQSVYIYRCTTNRYIYIYIYIYIHIIYICVPVAQWLEHCVSSAKVVGFDSQRTHILTIQMYSLNAL